MKKYPGVERVDHQRYRVRLKWRCAKTGKRREIDRIVVAATPAEALNQRAALRDQALAAAQPKTRPTVGDCARSWLISKHAEVKPSTWSLYNDLLRKHVLVALGDYYMDAVTRNDVLTWRAAQGGSPASINSRLRVLRTFFGDVCRERGLPNPTERVKRVVDEDTDSDDDRADSKVLTAAELACLLTAVRDIAPQHYPLVLTLALTGCRFGEATALRWTDIDEDAGVIRIRRSQWRGRVGTTKTRKTRTVALAPELADILRHHRLDMWRRAEGPIRPWVFTSRREGFLHSTTLRRPLAAASAAAGIGQHVSAHWFRHTMNDLLRQATTGQVQRAITGHVTQAMSEHYSHVAIEEKREALGRVLHLVRAASGGEQGGDRHVVTAPSTSDLARESLAG